MDSNDTATIVGFGKDYYELELDKVFAVSCSYTFGPMGATNVTIR